MPKFRVEVACLVRQTRVVIVEAPTREFLADRLDKVFEAACDLPDWEEDTDWGCDEGTHMILDEFPGTNPVGDDEKVEVTLKEESVDANG